MLRGRYIWSIILIFILNFVWLSTQGYSLVAQNTQNPFDLPQRLEILEKEKELSQETQKDSTATVSPSEDSNPFNVSHVPIKRVRPNTNNEVKLGSNLGSYFVFWISIISLLILALVLNLKRGLLKHVYKSILNENLLKLLKREEKSGLSMYYLMLYLVFLLSFSMFIYLLVERKFDISGTMLWVKILLRLLGFLTIKNGMYYLVKRTFPIEKEVSMVQFNQETFLIALGVFLIPINLLMAYSNDSVSSMAMYIGIASFVILSILLMLRSLLIGAKYAVNSFIQFFMYLCTLEIAPVLWIIGVLKELTK